MYMYCLNKYLISSGELTQWPLLPHLSFTTVLIISLYVFYSESVTIEFGK